jgi:hypothetical protein
MPKVGQAGEKHKSQTVTSGELRPFRLTIENNHLLAEDGILNNQINFTSRQV